MRYGTSRSWQASRAVTEDERGCRRLIKKQTNKQHNSLQGRNQLEPSSIFLFFFSFSLFVLNATEIHGQHGKKMQSIISAFPLFTPSKRASASPRVSLGTSSSIAGPVSPRLKLKKNSPGSTRRQSLARRLRNEETSLQKEDDDSGEAYQPNDTVGDSLQLEQQELVSASTPRAAPRASNVVEAYSTRSAMRAARISEILRRADIGAEETEEPQMEQEVEAADDEVNAVQEQGEGKEEEEEDEGDDGDEEQYGFEGFAGYRWVGDSIEIQVQWDGGETTWEPEANLHHDCPKALFEYWRSHQGRPKNPRDPEMYEVYSILKHNRNRSRLLVEWVGFERSEATWVSRKVIEETAKDVVDAYFGSVTTKRRKK